MKRRRRSIRRARKITLKFGVEPIILHAKIGGVWYWRALRWVRVPEPRHEATAA